MNDGHINQMYRIAGPSVFRFAAPVQDRVALWHWEQQDTGRNHSFGYRHGWRVEYWFKPNYEGYPEQPESSRMAFFGRWRTARHLHRKRATHAARPRQVGRDLPESAFYMVGSIEEAVARGGKEEAKAAAKPQDKPQDKPTSPRTPAPPRRPRVSATCG